MNTGTRSSPEDQVLSWMEESERLSPEWQSDAPTDWASYALRLAMEAERAGDPLAGHKNDTDARSHCAAGA